MDLERIDRLEVILKVVERCNLACSYCYYFEGGDQSYKSKPPVISLDVVRSVATFLREGVKETGIRSVMIVFHGGEPMMLKPNLFDKICALFKSELEPVCQIAFSIQTNGAHVTESWLSLFAKYRVHVGVSMDGMQREQDRFRKFHNGRGSFSVVAKNYKVLKEAQLEHGEVVDIISVLNAENDYGTLLRELNSSLGVEHFNFLLPDCNRDDGVPSGYSAADYGKVLCDIFDFWINSGNVYIREIDNLLKRFQLVSTIHGSKRQSTATVKMREYNQAIVIRSDGEVQIDDTLIPASEWRNRAPKRNVEEVSLWEYLSHPIFDEIVKYRSRPPDECKGCVWKNICNGGDLENRYSSKNGFNNASVYCVGLKMFYRKVTMYLRRNGYRRDVLRARLKPADQAKYRFLM